MYIGSCITQTNVTTTMKCVNFNAISFGIPLWIVIPLGFVLILIILTEIRIRWQERRGNILLFKRIKYIFTNKCDHKGTTRLITAETKSRKPFHECIICGALFKGGKLMGKTMVISK